MGLALTHVTAAHAQDAADSGPRGIRLGDFVLHSSVGSDVGYVTNVFNSHDPEGSAALRVGPRLELKSLESADGTAVSAPPVSLRAHAGGSFQTYFDTAARDALGMNAGLDLTINPERPVSFVVEESFSRTAVPFTESGLPKNSTANAPDYARNHNDIGGHLVLQSRGGLLQSAVGYKFGVDWFDDKSFDANDSKTHTIDMKSSWEFLPKTAFVHEASIAMQHFDTTTTDTTNVSDNDLVTTRVGINGGLTARTAGTLTVGYTAGFYDNNRDVEGINLNVEGRYVPSESTEFALGYDRSISQAFQGAFVGRHRIYTRGRVTVSQRLLLGAKAGAEFLKFGPDPDQNNERREDIRIFADATAEYRFLSWLALTSQLGFLTDITDFQYTIPGPTAAAPTTTDDAKFTAFEAWLGIRAFY